MGMNGCSNSADDGPSGKAKHRFTEYEDNVILQMVEELGVHEWGAISSRLGTRTPRQCRERWRHYLHQVIETSPWTVDEDTLLEEEFRKVGPKWSQIALIFRGRTEVNLKNRWTRLNRQRRKQADRDVKTVRPFFPLERELGDRPSFQVPTGVRIIFPPIDAILPDDDKMLSPSAFDWPLRLPTRP
jgi:hypothetical protein